jgi:hypothetical protein
VIGLEPGRRANACQVRLRYTLLAVLLQGAYYRWMKRTRITLTIAAACKVRGLDTAYKLQTRLGFLPSTASRLFKGEFTKIEIETLERLMDGLSKHPEARPKPCKLGELISVTTIEDDHKG